MCMTGVMVFSCFSSSACSSSPYNCGGHHVVIILLFVLTPSQPVWLPQGDHHVDENFCIYNSDSNDCTERRNLRLL